MKTKEEKEGLMKMLLASFMAEEIVSRASDMAWEKNPLCQTPPL